MMTRKISRLWAFPMLAAGLLLSMGSEAHSRKIDIRDHGAKAGDGADDAGAIQAALDAAAAGDTVSLPAGSWHLGRTLTPKSGTAVLGAGTATELFYLGAAKAAFFALGGRSGVEIGQMSFKGNANTTNGVKADHGSGHNLHHLRMSDFAAEGFSSTGIHFSSAVTGSLIAENEFTNMTVAGEWGGAIRVSQGSSGNRILRNTISNTGRGGIFADNDSRRLHIAGNRITGSGKGMGGEAPGLGLEIWGGCDSALIEDNVVDHWLSVDNSDFTAVRRNTVGTRDGTFKYCALELVGSNWCLFTDNTTDDGSNIGISVSNHPKKDYVYWAYNTVRASNTWGAQIQGDSGGVRYHYFYRNRFLDTPRSHPLALYTGQGHGMRFNANCHFMTVDSNEFSGNGGSAVQWLGALEHFSFIRNVISGNAGVASGAFQGAVLAWEGNQAALNATNSQPAATVGAASLAVTATFSAPASSPIPAPDGSMVMEFSDGTLFTAGGVGARYLWDFGDGLPSDARNGVHRYPGKGLYRVTLVVWDKDGRAGRSERMIQVGQINVGVGVVKGTGDKRMAGAARSGSGRVPAFLRGSRLFDPVGREAGRATAAPLR